jgi:p21-activated kinase 1
MEESKHSSRRLTKKPPVALAQYPGFDSRLDESSVSLHSQRSSSGSLQRAPSAPYPRSQNLSSGHVRTATSPNALAYTSSSSSSLERQVGSGLAPPAKLAASDFGAPPAPMQGGSGSKRLSNPVVSRFLNEKTTEESFGAPFDGAGIINQIDSTKASGYQNSLRRPPPPPLSHTSPAVPMMGPQLRQSQSFSASDARGSEKTPPRVGDNMLSNIKRYSDEGKEGKNTGLRKKSGFSGFMRDLVGSPKRVNISAPENPVHVTHVGYDNETGQFTVSNIQYALLTCRSAILTSAGTSQGMATHA